MQLSHPICLLKGSITFYLHPSYHQSQCKADYHPKNHPPGWRFTTRFTVFGIKDVNQCHRKFSIPLNDFYGPYRVWMLYFSAIKVSITMSSHFCLGEAEGTRYHRQWFRTKLDAQTVENCARLNCFFGVHWLTSSKLSNTVSPSTLLFKGFRYHSFCTTVTYHKWT